MLRKQTKIIIHRSQKLHSLKRRYWSISRANIPAVSPIFAFIVEVILTFILMFVILNVSTGRMEKGIMAGVAIGGTITIAALVAGPLTGASMNPVRSLAPALLSGNTLLLWLYFFAPIFDAILASPLCRIIQGKECCHVREDEENI